MDEDERIQRLRTAASAVVATEVWYDHYVRGRDNRVYVTVPESLYRELQDAVAAFDESTDPDGIREDRSDTRRSLVRHTPSGEAYLTEYCSLWDANDNCVGARTIASSGPIPPADIPHYHRLGDNLTYESRCDIVRWMYGVELDDTIDWILVEEASGRFAEIVSE